MKLEESPVAVKMSEEVKPIFDDNSDGNVREVVIYRYDDHGNVVCGTARILMDNLDLPAVQD